MLTQKDQIFCSSAIYNSNETNIYLNNQVNTDKIL